MHITHKMTNYHIESCYTGGEQHFSHIIHAQFHLFALSIHITRHVFKDFSVYMLLRAGEAEFVPMTRLV